VRTSWLWASVHNRREEIDNAMESLWFFYDTRGLYHEGWQAFQTAVESQDTGLTLGKLLAHLGSFNFSLGQPEQAHSILEQSLILLRQHDAPQEVGSALLRLSEVVMFGEGNPEEAKIILRESLSLFQELRDEWGTAYAVRWLGFAALCMEEFEEARRLCQQSLTISQAEQDHWGTAIALSLVGLVALGMGDYQEAKRAAQESLALCQEINLFWVTAQNLVIIAGAACAFAEYQESKRYFYDALRLTHKRLPIHDTLWVLGETANLWIAVGKPEWALEILACLIHTYIPSIINRHGALRCFAKLESELPSDMVKTAIERGKSRDLDTIVHYVLAELEVSQVPIQIAHSTPTQPLIDSLTGRELEILYLMADGLSNVQIARKLVVAVGTVKAHTNSIFSKLGVNNRVQATNRAKELRLL
jgi:non-specific serine/threonine protein kinase